MDISQIFTQRMINYFGKTTFFTFHSHYIPPPAKSNVFLKFIKKFLFWLIFIKKIQGETFCAGLRKYKNNALWFKVAPAPFQKFLIFYFINFH